MYRRPIVAGMFYDLDDIALKKSINQFLKAANPKKIELKGMISPHAGYMYSGKCAGFGFKLLQNKKFDIVIVLGFSHRGIDEKASTLLVDWETPLGIIEVDKNLGQKLVDKGLIEINELSHREEHSIEVQLPFLQIVLPNTKFLPISVSPFDDYEKLGKGIREVLGRKKFLIIASSDFTHYGFNYGYTPFTERVKQNLKKLDFGAIEFIKKMDSAGFLTYTDETGATICGRHAIALMIEILKKDVKNVDVLEYYTSGDIVGDYRNSVSYACVGME